MFKKITLVLVALLFAGILMAGCKATASMPRVRNSRSRVPQRSDSYYSSDVDYNTNTTTDTFRDRRTTPFTTPNTNPPATMSNDVTTLPYNTTDSNRAVNRDQTNRYLTEKTMVR